MTELLSSKELVKKYHQFIEGYYEKELRQIQTGELQYLKISLNDLCEFDYNLIELFVSEPNEHLNIIKVVLKDTKFRLTDIPETELVTLNELRKEHINKLVSIKGMIKRKSDVLPKIKEIQYLCTNHDCTFAQEPIKIPQTGTKKKGLKACPRCKSGIELIKEIDADFQIMVIEEKSDELDNPNILPKSKPVYLEDDLTVPDMDNTFLVGSKVNIIGIVRKKTIETNKGENLLSELYIETLDIQNQEDARIDLTITPEDEKKILELSKKPDLFEMLSDSIAPNIAGRQRQKEATLYYVVGGNGGKDQRKHIHLMVIGNASLGKSQILRRLSKFLPRTMYASGENTSKAGLTGAAVKDEMTGAWTIECGAISLANNGYFFLDEADKMNKEDQTNMNEALEHQTVTINKIVKGQLGADCPCYAAANPAGGQFDNNSDYSKQIKFDPTFLSRFDLIFILNDEEGDKEQDEVLDKLIGLEDSNKKYIEDDLLRKYLFYAKNFKPTMSKEIKERIKSYYKMIYQTAKTNNNFAITYRQFGAITRLCEARAKLRLSNEVSLDDVGEVIGLMNYCLNKFGVSEIETGISNTSRNKLNNFKQAIELLDNTQGKFTKEDLDKTLQEMKILLPDSEIEKTLEQMKSEGYIFSPQKKQYKLIV